MIDALLKIANVIVDVLLLQVLLVMVIAGRLVLVLNCLLVVARKLVLSLVGGGGDFHPFLINSEWRGSSLFRSCSASS